MIFILIVDGLRCGADQDVGKEVPIGGTSTDMEYADQYLLG
jgi:hypothetical protein